MIINNINKDLSLEEGFFKVLWYLLPSKFNTEYLWRIKDNGY